MKVKQMADRTIRNGKIYAALKQRKCVSLTVDSFRQRYSSQSGVAVYIEFPIFFITVAKFLMQCHGTCTGEKGIEKRNTINSRCLEVEGTSETLRDIITSIHQICRIERIRIKQSNFTNKYGM